MAPRAPRYRAPKAAPEHLRHRIVSAGAEVELRTHYGYVLKAFASVEEAEAYYAWHVAWDDRAAGTILFDSP